MNHTIILAAGSGKRMKAKEDKLFLEAGGHPLIYHSIQMFNDHSEIDQIFVVASKSNKKQIEELVKSAPFRKVQKVLIGGNTRQASLEKGFSAIKAKNEDLVLVHNGANPLVTLDEITESLQAAEELGAAIVGHFISSTVKEVNDTHIIKTHDRRKLFAAQTPQVAQYHLLEKAIKKGKNLEATDEAMLLENIGVKVAHVTASEDNFKVTTHSDYQKVKAIFGDLPTDFFIGLGQDSHHFSESKRGLALAGITFPDQPKLEANSDGDVILHAIFNAISQAIGDKSLGFYADPLCAKGITDSRKYLEPLLKKLKKQSLRINTLGLMLECSKPKIDPIAPQLKKSLSEILDLNTRRIGITATTGEHLTSFGEGLGIQCFAIISLVKA